MQPIGRCELQIPTIAIVLQPNFCETCHWTYHNGFPNYVGDILASLFAVCPGCRHPAVNFEKQTAQKQPQVLIWKKNQPDKYPWVSNGF